MRQSFLYFSKLSVVTNLKYFLYFFHSILKHKKSGIFTQNPAYISNLLKLHKITYKSDFSHTTFYMEQMLLEKINPQ